MQFIPAECSDSSELWSPVYRHRRRLSLNVPREDEVLLTHTTDRRHGLPMTRIWPHTIRFSAVQVHDFRSRTTGCPASFEAGHPVTLGYGQVLDLVGTSRSRTLVGENGETHKRRDPQNRLTRYHNRLSDGEVSRPTSATLALEIQEESFASTFAEAAFKVSPHLVRRAAEATGGYHSSSDWSDTSSHPAQASDSRTSSPHLVQASLLVAEPRLKLQDRPREVRSDHFPRLSELTGDPISALCRVDTGDGAKHQTPY